MHDGVTDLEATYQESTIRAGDEVDYFAAQLDRYNSDPTGSAAEKRAQVFNLVDSYYTYTRNRANQLHDRQSRDRSGRRESWQRAGSADMDIDGGDDGAATPSLEEARRVEEEAQTWDLLRRILPLRYGDTPASQQRNEDDAKSRRQWWNEFLVADSVAHERKIVLEWLQSSASHGPPIDEVVSELQHNAERGDILAHGWLHTRHKIKLQKSINGYQGILDPNDAATAESHLGSNTLITQLDPDAITRQGRKLEPQDEFFERAIWLGCFEMLRRGCSMSEIREWCSVRMELWRASSIGPLPLSNPEDEEQPEFEPSSLVLWRRMCFATARDGGTSEYDRAVYGLLAGDIPSVEKVCKSWDDFLFTHYNALLRTQFDLFLAKHGGDNAAKAAQQFPSFNAVMHHSDPITASKHLIALLEADQRTSKEAKRTAKSLQGAIVANDVDRHLFHQGVVLARHANQKQKSKLIPEFKASLVENISQERYFDLSDHDGTRILAHVLIVISTLDRLGGLTEDRGSFHVRHQAQENIIAAYISYLRLANLEEMIPLYCSKLYGARLYETLSRNLIHIVDNEARVHQLTIMEKLGLDLAEFVKSQPRIYLEDVQDESLRCEAKGRFKILESGPATLKYGRVVKPDFFGEDAEFVDQEDDVIIRSMEWLMLVPGLFEETCTYAIRIYKYFLSAFPQSRRLPLRCMLTIHRAQPAARRARLERTDPWARNREDQVAHPSEGSERGFRPRLVRGICQRRIPGRVFGHVQAGEEQADHDRPKSVGAGVPRPRFGFDGDAILAGGAQQGVCLPLQHPIPMPNLANMAGNRESSTSREMWQHTSQEVRSAKACMQPVLKNWLLVTNEGRPAVICD